MRKRGSAGENIWVAPASELKSFLERKLFPKIRFLFSVKAEAVFIFVKERIIKLSILQAQTLNVLVSVNIIFNVAQLLN